MKTSVDIYIYTITYIINNFDFMNNIYTVLEEGKVFPTQKLCWL